MHILRFFAVAAIAAAPAHPALAVAGDVKPRAQRVSYADLDLGKEADRAAFARRVEKAVIAVCGVRTAGDKVGAARVAQCRQLTGEAARVQVARLGRADKPQLATIEVAPIAP